MELGVHRSRVLRAQNQILGSTSNASSVRFDLPGPFFRRSGTYAKSPAKGQGFYDPLCGTGRLSQKNKAVKTRARKLELVPFRREEVPESGTPYFPGREHGMDDPAELASRGHSGRSPAQTLLPYFVVLA